MEYEEKDGTGVMYINEDVIGKRPNVSGHLIINGERVKFAGWNKVSKKGNKFVSLKVDYRE